MKKALVAFIVSLGLTVGLSALSLIVNDISFYYQTYPSLILSLVAIGLFFASFYVLGNYNKITAEKSTTIAILLGILLGSALSPIFAWGTSILLYLSALLWTALATGVVQYFFPSLTALLLAELRNKKSNNNLANYNQPEKTT